jgi:hypothetical protein
MSDSASNHQTDIDGGAANVLSGTFSGEIHIASSADIDELAEELIDKYGPRKAEFAVILGTQQRLVELETNLRTYFTNQEAERRQREAATDTYRAENDRRLGRIETAVSRSMWTSGAALLAAGAAWLRGESRQ